MLIASLFSHLVSSVSLSSPSLFISKLRLEAATQTGHAVVGLWSRECAGDRPGKQRLLEVRHKLIPPVQLEGVMSYNSVCGWALVRMCVTGVI